MREAGDRVDAELNTEARLCRANLAIGEEGKRGAIPVHLGRAAVLDNRRGVLHCHIIPTSPELESYYEWVPRAVIDELRSGVQDKNDCGELWVRTWFAEEHDLPYTERD